MLVVQIEKVQVFLVVNPEQAPFLFRLALVEVGGVGFLIKGPGKILKFFFDDREFRVVLQFLYSFVHNID